MFIESHATFAEISNLPQAHDEFASAVVDKRFVDKIGDKTAI